MFSYSANGADSNAAIYSLVTTAKENKLHVEEYLNDVFSKLPILKQEENHSFKALLPWDWAQQNPQHVVPEKK